MLQRSCASEMEPMYSLGRSPNLRSQTFAYSRTAIHDPSLPFNGLHPSTVWNLHGLLLTWRPKRDGRLSWLPHNGQFTHKVVTCQSLICHSLNNTFRQWAITWI